MRRQILASTSVFALLLGAQSAFAGMDEAKAFLDAEIKDMSALDRAAQEAEMQWFIDAAKPLAGMDIKVVSETITTHEYESKVLAPAFTAKATWSRSSRRRCSRARTCTTPTSTTPT